MDDKQGIEYVILKKLIDNLTSGILIEDENRIIIKSNLCFSSMFDIPLDPEQLKGQDCTLIGESISSMFVDPVKFSRDVDVVLKNRKIALNDIVYVNNGKILERDYIPMVIEGNYIGHVWHYRDITSKMKKNEYLKKSIEDNSYILANIGHEVRNPLNCIIGLADLMIISDVLEEDQINDLQMIKSSGEAILDITNSIVDKARGKGQAIYEVFNVSSYIKNILSFLKFAINQKGIELTEDIRLDGVDVYSCKIYIRQIITNIVNNSIKYTDSGYIHVKCWGNGTRIKIQITDTGIGIPEDKLEDIFKPFVQLDSNKSGIGLGLHITSDLINYLHGDIKVESKIGVGSSFTISLPTK